MTHIVHIHSSSRYDRSLASLTRAVKEYNRKADLVTYTEVDANVRERTVKAAGGDAWGIMSGDNSYADDCAITWRKSRFTLIHSESFETTSVPFYFSGSNRRRDPQWATVVVLRDRTFNKKLVVVAVHLASGVEGDMRTGNRTKGVKNWYASFAGTKKRANQLKRKFKADGVMIVADWNVSFKQAWFRSILKTLAPSYRHTWTIMPHTGTHGGGRVIDGTIVRGNLKGRAQLFKDDNSSDHRPFIDRLTWTKK